MSDEFIPEGYAGLPAIIWYIAQRSHPDLWASEHLHELEISIWSHLVINNDAKFILDRLRYPFFERNLSFPDETQARFRSYDEAERKLRQALYAGSLTAFFNSSASATAGQMMHVLRDGWSIDSGRQILWSGRANLAGEPSQRVVFVSIFSVRQHFWGEQQSQPEKAEETSIKAVFSKVSSASRRGRPESYNWQAAEAYARELLKHHGPPSPDDPEFPNQAAFERMISEFFAKISDRIPAESVIRKRAKGWLECFLTEGGK
ncbi:hypothetical protein [Bosea sp. (in: a-proteobacteria)]|uniref:hypothetical protein n=1 Tax=Bosea sp. (in: a-proteobacteria) TaxID=1871050 RepID=UPI001AD14303|nr:hypothetical protein [Bosea sp. (in: a-proteobacteria)]MBN9435573.1 hypothetical protein [Bosea sp. (in: a-proteobacteria)]